MTAAGAAGIPDKAEVLATLTRYLVEMFEVPAEAVRLEAKLFEDLDLDSIDAVDLVVRLQDYTGRKIPVAEFKSVRTVGDVVDQVHALLEDPA
jgi:acyl carrier protein